MNFTIPILVLINNKIQIFYSEISQENNLWKSICLNVPNSYYEHKDLHRCLVGLIENIKKNYYQNSTLLN